MDAVQVEYQANRMFEGPLVYFENLGSLGPPATPRIRKGLIRKLQEYCRRRDDKELWNFKPAPLAFHTEPVFRDTIYKIVLTEAVLRASSEGVNLRDVARDQIEKYGDLFDPIEFLNVCKVVSAYLGTPIVEGQTQKDAGGGKMVRVRL